MRHQDAIINTRFDCLVGIWPTALAIWGSLTQRKQGAGESSDIDRVRPAPLPMGGNGYGGLGLGGLPLMISLLTQSRHKSRKRSDARLASQTTGIEKLVRCLTAMERRRRTSAPGSLPVPNFTTYAPHCSLIS